MTKENFFMDRNTFILVLLKRFLEIFLLLLYPSSFSSLPSIDQIDVNIGFNYCNITKLSF